MNSLLGFLFIFSIFGVINLFYGFVKNLLSTPPKPFEITLIEKIIYGTFLSYIITYLIFI
jgi:hypothetical protein